MHISELQKEDKLWSHGSDIMKLAIGNHVDNQAVREEGIQSISPFQMLYIIQKLQTKTTWRNPYVRIKHAGKPLGESKAHASETAT